MGNQIPLERVDANRWCIPMRYNAAMRVPGMVYADDELIELMKEDNALQQVVNVASFDAQMVVNVVHNAGLATLVARLKPIVVVKG